MTTIDIDKLADEVGAKGKTVDGTLSDLRKGLTDGFAMLADLIKGGSKPMDKPEDKPADKPADKGDADDKGKDDEGEQDDPTGDDEPNPGYPMQKGEGGVQFVDATEMLLKMAADMQKLVKGQAEQSKEIAALTAQNQELKSQVEHTTKVVAVGLQPLYKAVSDMSMSLDKIGTMAPTSATNAAAARAGIDAAIEANKTQTTGIDKGMLANALRKGVIDDSLVRRFNRTGKFDDDETKNADLANKVKAA